LTSELRLRHHGLAAAGLSQKAERLRVADWEHPANNDFLLVNQFCVTGRRGRWQKDE